MLHFIGGPTQFSEREGQLFVVFNVTVAHNYVGKLWNFKVLFIVSIRLHLVAFMSGQTHVRTVRLSVKAYVRGKVLLHTGQAASVFAEWKRRNKDLWY
jgi:hypothetical protein